MNEDASFISRKGHKLFLESQEDTTDAIAIEEPLEIQINGISVAVLMRTPGHDEELVRGFLLTEGIINTPKDIRSIRKATRVQRPEAEDNVCSVILEPEVEVPWTRLRRHMYASSSCGICGKASIDAVLQQAPPLPPEASIGRQHCLNAIEQLRHQQTLFSKTGGTHAAGLFDNTGTLLLVHEDVGRHNAVDKCLGSPHTGNEVMLAISGRISFEITQKAVMGKIPIVLGVSAPTSLAIDFAESSGLCLAGFVRENRMTVFSHPQRIRSV